MIKGSPSGGLTTQIKDEALQEIILTRILLPKRDDVVLGQFIHSLTVKV